MIDSLILAQLGKRLRIGEVTYHVAWDAEANVAIILYVEDNTDPMGTYVPQIYELLDVNSDVMTFATELDAHRYLTGLYYEYKEPNFSWKDLT